jgi:hypothetical protein
MTAGSLSRQRRTSKRPRPFYINQERAHAKGQLELAQLGLVLAQGRRAFHLEAYTAEIVGMWRAAGELGRQALAKMFERDTGRSLQYEVERFIIRALNKGQPRPGIWRAASGRC